MIAQLSIIIQRELDEVPLLSNECMKMPIHMDYSISLTDLLLFQTYASDGDLDGKLFFSSFAKVCISRYHKFHSYLEYVLQAY